MAKHTRPLTRKQRLEMAAKFCAENDMFFPSLDINGPTRPNQHYSFMLNTKTGEMTQKFEFCDNRRQVKIMMIADRLLSETGFFDESIELRAWMDEPENKGWVEACNPDAISYDGHLSASAAFC